MLAKYLAQLYQLTLRIVENTGWAMPIAACYPGASMH